MDLLCRKRTGLDKIWQLKISFRFLHNKLDEKNISYGMIQKSKVIQDKGQNIQKRGVNDESKKMEKMDLYGSAAGGSILSASTGTGCRKSGSGRYHAPCS